MKQIYLILAGIALLMAPLVSMAAQAVPSCQPGLFTRGLGGLQLPGATSRSEIWGFVEVAQTIGEGSKSGYTIDFFKKATDLKGVYVRVKDASGNVCSQTASPDLPAGWIVTSAYLLSETQLVILTEKQDVTTAPPDPDQPSPPLTPTN